MSHKNAKDHATSKSMTSATPDAPVKKITPASDELDEQALDKVSGGDVWREVVRTPPRTKSSTYTQGGITHEDVWNSQT